VQVELHAVFVAGGVRFGLAGRYVELRVVQEDGGGVRATAGFVTGGAVTK
jgi:hypothetical protein